MAQTLYDRLGGDAAIEAVVEEFYDRVLADESLRPYFDGVDVQELRDHQAKFISHVAGGPVEYAGRSMAEAHAHLDVTGEDFGRVAEHLDASLREFDVPEAEREEVLAAVGELEDDIVTA